MKLIFYERIVQTKGTCQYDLTEQRKDFVRKNIDDEKYYRIVFAK